MQTSRRAPVVLSSCRTYPDWGIFVMKRREFLAGTLGTVALAGLASKAVQAAGNPASGAYAELPGVKLWFTDSGGTGAPIILLHANTGTSAVWASQVEGFS